MIYLFCGPTISSDDVRRHLSTTRRNENGERPPLVCLPPVAQGDVYRATLDQPTAIAIVDGYFERVPAVWHKEILWAMSRGIHVFGSSSMGALRAAELEQFGMVGVGRIFEAYRDGVLEDDDEVAVAHGGEEDGYRAASEAMVNIRATLERAVDDGVLDEAERAALETLAKGLSYPQRSMPQLARAAEAGPIAPDRLAAFADWARRSRVDLKRDDAIELLDALAELTTATPPKSVRWEFQHTELWEHALRAGGREPVRGVLAGRPASIVDDPLGVSESLLDELRLAGRDTYRDRRDVWLARALALEEARRHEAAVSDDALHLATSHARRRHALESREQTLAWAERQGLDETALLELMRDEAKIESMRGLYARECSRQMAADLRVRDRLAPLLERVRDKRRVLGDEGVGSIAPAGDGPELPVEALLAWHFGRLGTAVPDDLEQYARDLDLPGSDVLIRMIRRDHRYETDRCG